MLLGFVHGALNDRAVASKGSGWGKFAKAMANHRFRYKDIDKFVAIVNLESMSDKFGGNLRAPSPGFNRRFGPSGHPGNLF